MKILYFQTTHLKEVGFESPNLDFDERLAFPAREANSIRTAVGIGCKGLLIKVGVGDPGLRNRPGPQDRYGHFGE